MIWLQQNKKIEACLKYSYYHHGREWPYKNVKPRILAEQYMKDDQDQSGDPATTDYKFFCFNGVPKIMYIAKDKSKDPRTDYFDMDFQHLPIRMRDPNADIPQQKPKQFEEMKELASKLSAGIPHLRVDFYIFNDKVYVGELTFDHNSGSVKSNPKNGILPSEVGFRFPNNKNLWFRGNNHYAY